MPTRSQLSVDDFRRAFDGGATPPILGPKQFAALLGVSIKTVYSWLSQGRLKGAARKRGKRVFIWRDRAMEIIFNGPDWNHE